MTAITLPKQVKYALDTLSQSGFEAFAVGGCVRDEILHAAPKDYDIATSALPEQTAEVFSEYTVAKTGIKHGTVTLLINGMPIEITTYRIESEYSDNRRPDSVAFTKNLKLDLSRRDFTINALAYNEDLGIIDCFGGLDDIKSGVVRCVGEPDKRFSEDALRILRALRFASTLGFEIEYITAKAAIDNKRLLQNISAERIASELTGILCGKNAQRVLTQYTPIFTEIIPELAPMIGFEQYNEHHIYDVYAHSAAAVQNTPSEPALRLAALLHDAGKPACFTLDENGVGHFYGHAAIGADIARNILNRLKFDNATKSLVVTLVKYHDMQIEPTQKSVKRAMNKLSEDFFFKLISLKRADNLAQSPKYIQRQKYYEELTKIAENIISQRQCFSLKDMAVDGRDLLNAGISPGKDIGIALKFLLDAVLNESVKNTKLDLLKYLDSNTQIFLADKK